MGPSGFESANNGVVSSPFLRLGYRLGARKGCATIAPLQSRTDSGARDVIASCGT